MQPCCGHSTAIYSHISLLSWSCKCLQGKFTYIIRHHKENDACTAAIEACKQHAPPELHAYICQAFQPTPSRLPAAEHGKMQACSPDISSEHGRPLLRRFLQATRDSRMMAHIHTQTPAFANEHQQQQIAEVQQPASPVQKAVRSRNSPAQWSFRPIVDGRYRLPPLLRKTAGSGWIRGYCARIAQAEPPTYTYGVDIRYKVRTSRPAALLNGGTCIASIGSARPGNISGGVRLCMMQPMAWYTA